LKGKKTKTPEMKYKHHPGLLLHKCVRQNKAIPVSYQQKEEIQLDGSQR